MGVNRESVHSPRNLGKLSLSDFLTDRLHNVPHKCSIKKTTGFLIDGYDTDLFVQTYK